MAKKQNAELRELDEAVERAIEELGQADTKRLRELAEMIKQNDGQPVIFGKVLAQLFADLEESAQRDRFRAFTNRVHTKNCGERRFKDYRNRKFVRHHQHKLFCCLNYGNGLEEAVIGYTDAENRRFGYRNQHYQIVVCDLLRRYVTFCGLLKATLMQQLNLMDY